MKSTHLGAYVATVTMSLPSLMAQPGLDAMCAGARPRSSQAWLVVTPQAPEKGPQGPGGEAALPPQGYRALLPPGTKLPWDATPEGKQSLEARAQDELVLRQNPLMFGRLSTVSYYRGYVESQVRASQDLQQELDKLRSRLRDAREFGMTDNVVVLERQVGAIESRLVELLSVKSLIQFFRTVRSSWELGQPSGGRPPQLRFAMFGGLLADVRMQPRAELLEQIRQTQAAIVSLLQDGYSVDRVNVMRLSGEREEEARTLARELGKIRERLEQDDEAGAQQALDKLWGEVLASWQDAHVDAIAQEEATVEFPDSSEREAWREARRPKLSQQFALLEKEGRLVAASRLGTHIRFLDFLHEHVARRDASAQSLKELRLQADSFPSGSAERAFFDELIEKAEQPAKELEDQRRATLVRLWLQWVDANARGNDTWGVFFADPVHGQSLTDLSGRLKKTETLLREMAARAVTSGGRLEAQDLGIECERIRGLLRAGLMEEAQSALDVQWALVMSADAPGVSVTSDSDAVSIPLEWIELAKRGEIDGSIPGRSLAFSTFRHFLQECEQSRNAATGSVPLSAVRALARPNGLLFFLSFAGDASLSQRVGGVRVGLERSCRTPEELAAMRPYLAAIDQVEGLLAVGDTEGAQAVLDARWQDVLRVVEHVYLPPTQEELTNTRFEIANRDWLLDGYSKRLRDRAVEVFQSGGSVRELGRLGVKWYYVRAFLDREHEVSEFRQRLSEGEQELARLERLGRPIDARLKDQCVRYRDNIAFGDTVALEQFGQGLRCNLQDFPHSPLREAAFLSSTGFWFCRRAADPRVAMELRQRIVKIEDLLDPPGSAPKPKGGGLGPRHAQDLRLVLEEFRRLLEDIESGRIDSAQSTMDRMAADVLSI